MIDTSQSDGAPGASVLGRSLRAFARYPRHSPATAAYLVVLAVDTVVVKRLLPEATAGRILHEISTNLDNLPRRPFTSLFGSLLVVDHGTWLDYLLVIGLGLAVCLALLERRIGTRRALAVVLLGHVGATLITSVIVAEATHVGTYPLAIRHALDYGVSYASSAAVAAITPLLPRLARPWWVVGAVVYPLTAADWYGRLPDFTTIGHVSAALIGLTAAIVMIPAEARRKGGDRAKSKVRAKAGAQAQSQAQPQAEAEAEARVRG
ncbi:rhomboid-like protein [Streptomyces sp. NPDC048506]|uniref:rhomboid-like protein n=1 Tax=Streptomyces sp. NPDC048506 TaxID=3155028 RepID=UPI003419D9CF